MSSRDRTHPGGHRTLVDLFEWAAHAYDRREAIVAGPERLTFGEWWTRAGGMALALRDRGVRKGDVVAAIVPTSIDYAVLYMAVVRLGGVMTGVNPRLGPTEVEAVFERCRPRVAVVADDHARSLVPASLGAVDLDVIRSAGVADLRSPALSPSDPVAIVWTSGTTGVPKGAWFDHTALRGAAECAGDLTAEGDRRLVPLPFQHAGFMTKPWDLACSGSAIVLSSTPWSAEDMLRQIVEERITVAVGVPTQWAKVLALPALASADLSHLRVAVTSTAPAPPTLVRSMRSRLGCSVLVRYATTETAVGTGTRIDDSDEVVFATVGRVQSGVAARVVDDGGACAPPGDIGQIEIRTLAQMRGYWNDAERTAEAITPDGWIRTRDLGWFRPDGNLVLCGRTTDMYIRGGYNVYPLEVENAIGSHPKVSAIAVVGAPAPVIGEIGVAVVVPTDPASPPDLDDLRAWSKERIADYKAPDRLVLVDDLPRNGTLKVSRPALRALVDEAFTRLGEVIA